MMIRHLSYGLRFLVTAGVAAGCGDSPPPMDSNGELGSFVASISGDFTRELSGSALFGSGDDPDTGEFFSLWLGSGLDVDADAVIFVRTGSGRPGEGAYAIADADEFGTATWNDQDFSAAFNATTAAGTSVSGSVVVTTSTDDRLSGSFTFSGVGVVDDDAGNLKDVTVEGEFDARWSADLSLPD